MLSGAQDCFQLIRIGSSAGDSARDLYTFRPALSHCVFRLGRVAEFCDVTLNSTSVSRVHAELHTERQVGRGEEAAPEEGWKVSVKDRSSHGTWVNDVRLQSGVLWELSDGDTLIFGGQSTPGNPEFYFLFQKVKVRPQDFDAITIPKTGAFSSDLERRIRTSQDCKSANSLDLSRLSINTSTIILNSIGSLSKMKGTSWTFQRSHSHDGTSSDPGSSSSSSPTTGFTSLVPPVTSPTLAPITSQSATKAFPPASRSRRKSAHTVLLEDVGSDELRSRAAVVPVLDDGTRVRAKKRRRLYRSDGLVSPPPLPPQPKAHAEVRHQHASKPFPVGIRTIGSFHGAMTNSQLGGGHALQSFRSSSAPDAVCRVQTLFNRNITSFCHQKGGHRSSQRGRQRLHSAPVFSPLVVGGENYSRASPSVRVRTEERSRVPFQRFHHPTSKRRGRPRKHPLPPRPSLPSPSSSSSSSSSSTSSASSSSGSSSSSSDDDDDDEEGAVTGSVEPCAALRCRLPQQDTVQWIQCDVCDAWYHIDCLHVDRKKLLMDPKADFHCGCR